MSIAANTIFGAWWQLLRAVMAEGHSCAPQSFAGKGRLVKELIGTQIVIEQLRDNILVHPDRDLNYRFMVAEWLWILSGDNRVETVSKYNKQLLSYSDDGVTFAGAYGPRLRPQLEWIVNCLRKDSDSRQAVAAIWCPCPAVSKDIPCTISLQVLLRKGRLHGVLNMRSNDLWLGTPYDFFNFSQIVNWLAGRLRVETGSMTFQAGSSHIYEDNFEAALKVIASPAAGYTLTSPPIRNNLAPSIIWPGPGSALVKLGVRSACLTWLEKLYESVLEAPNKKEALKILHGPQRMK